MARFGPKLQYKQAVLGRLVDVGAELYAMSAAIVRAHHLRNGAGGREMLHMADVFCRRARLRIARLFDELFDNADAPTYKLAQQVVAGEHEYLEQGIVRVFDQIPTADITPGGGGKLRPTKGGRKLSETREATQIAAGG